MATLEHQVSTTSIDPATRIGVVSLTVAKLERSIAFYTDAMGFTVLTNKGSVAVLGVGDTPLLLLHEQLGALPWMVDNMTGLYHFAILVPSRVDLGRWLRHYIGLGFPPPGQGDHIVSEALYLRDPDGHGIEVYRDRPRDGWHWTNDRVQMGAGPVDIRGLLAEADATTEPWNGLREGTILGHIHLQVGDIAQAEEFYHGVLGFDVIAKIPQALFVSAGGYHHHLGMNTWHSQNASPTPDDAASLRFYSIAIPSRQALADVVTRLGVAGRRYQETETVVRLDDPWSNAILLHVGDVLDVETASALPSLLSESSV